MRALQRPPGSDADKAALDRYLSALDGQVAATKRLRDAAARNDGDGVSAAETDLQSSQAASLAARYRLEVLRGARLNRRLRRYLPGPPMPADLSLGEAAAALGVSVDTLRRWDRNGRIQTKRDSRNRRLVPASEIRRLSARPMRHRTGTEVSARNRFTGVVRSVEADGVMALVELEAGPFLVTAAITRDSIEELGLAAGVEATAVVKATSVMIERGGTA